MRVLTSPIVEEVGYGMWGSVWKCEGRATNAVVAVKLVHRSKTSTTAARVRSLWNEFKVSLVGPQLDHC